MWDAGKAHFANRINKAYQAQQHRRGKLKPSMSSPFVIVIVGWEMRLSVLIDKLALRTKCEWSHLPDGSTLSTSLPSYRPIYLPWGVSVPVPVAKTLCQPISHVVRGLSRHWIEQRIALDRSDLSFSIPAPGNDSWATLMPTGSRPAQINNIQKIQKK